MYNNISVQRKKFYKNNLYFSYNIPVGGKRKRHKSKTLKNIL